MQRWISNGALAGLSAVALACDGGGRPEPDPQAPRVEAVALPLAQLPQTEAVSEPVVPAAPPPLMPRGLITAEPGATAGYVLFNPLLSDTTYLVDNNGRIVHLWKTATSPGGGIYLLPNGSLLRPGRDPAMLGFRAGGTGGILQEISWDGTVVWEWRFSDEGRVLHHDIEPLPNGNLLAIAWEVKSAEEARRAGRRADRTPEQGLWPDWVLEIEPVRPDGAKIVWEWHVWDHLVQDADAEAANYGGPEAHPERLDINADAGAEQIDAAQLAQLQALGYVPADAQPEDLASDFLHVNAIDYHPRLDQIALSVPEHGEIWIIDHTTTPAEAAGSTGGRAGRGGDLLYRWGNPAVYRRGTKSDQRFFYQHDVRWIPDGWEGAGNLTVFNNGRDRSAGPWSSIDEWTPPMGLDGRYALLAGGGTPGAESFGPTQLAWQYRAPDPTSFFAPFISGAQRHANGNTLICDGTGGRIFEVNRAGELLWEYRNPFSGEVRIADGSMPQPGLENSPYAVFRATRIPADHPALVGRSLAPLDPQPVWYQAEGGDS